MIKINVWNEICTASRLPVRPDDKAVAVFIAPAKDADGRYEPLSLPFRGVYDGAGRLKNMEYDASAIKSLANTAFYESGVIVGEKNVILPPSPHDADWEPKLMHMMDAAHRKQLHIRNADVRLAFFHNKMWIELVYRGKSCPDAGGNPELWPALQHMTGWKQYAPPDIVAAHNTLTALHIPWRPSYGTERPFTLNSDWQPGFYSMIAEMAAQIWWEAPDHAETQLY